MSFSVRIVLARGTLGPPEILTGISLHDSSRGGERTRLMSGDILSFDLGRQTLTIIRAGYTLSFKVGDGFESSRSPLPGFVLTTPTCLILAGWFAGLGGCGYKCLPSGRADILNYELVAPADKR
jgi:hypothetical protein